MILRAPVAAGLALWPVALALWPVTLALWPVTLAAQPLPGPDACFARDYDAAHLARNPQQGVAGLRLWFTDEYRGDPGSRILILQAAMAGQGQGRADGVAGLTLRTTLYCQDDPGLGPACFVDCDGGHVTLQPLDGGGLELVTAGVSIGHADTCGGSTDLAEGGRTTRYRLAAVPAADCADLARVHPLPEPGCYGLAYAGNQATAGGVAALTLRLDPPELGGAVPAFPWLHGVMAIDFADAPGTPGMAGLAGARVMLPLWCGSERGTCAAGPEDGSWTFAAAGGRLELESRRFLVYDADDHPTDITGGVPVRHLLMPLIPVACAGLVLE